MDFSPSELNQLEGALMDQLSRLADADIRMTPGTFEAECVTDAIRFTGSALTKVQLFAHGVDDPDEPTFELLAYGPSDIWHEFLDR